MPEREIQTETHPVPPGKTYDYRWNEWDIRRRLLTLADIQSKKTTSTQTEETFHRLQFGTQIHGFGSKASQTGNAKATQTQTKLCD